MTIEIADHNACRRNQISVGLLLLMTLLVGCSQDPAIEPRLLVYLDRLPETAENIEYQLWYSSGEEMKSLKRFRTETGTVNLSLPMTPAIAAADTILLTVEPRYFFFDVPSDSTMLAGDLIDGEAELLITHPKAINTDFTSANGTFRLATPTSLETNDYDQGLWWFDTDGDKLVQSLFLPELPPGWMYEGWVIGGLEPLSLGKFPDPSRFDFDLAGIAADEEPAPPFPGQDYIEPPELVRGRTAMISVEPQPDYAIAPSGIEILFDQVIEPLGVNQPMENRTDRGLPSGRVTISNGLASN